MPGRATNEPGNYFAFGKQTAKDSEASTFFFAKHLDGSGFEVDEDVQREREGGDGQEVGLTYKSRVVADGQLVARSRPELLGRILGGVLGQDTVASVGVGGTALQDHTLVPVASIPYYTVEQAYADEVERSTNNQFTGVTIEWEAGRPFGVTTNYVNGGSIYQRDQASVLTATREAFKPHFYAHASVTFDGAANTKITKGKIEIKRNVDEDIQTIGLNREDVVPLNFDVDADLTLKYEDRTLYRKAQYNGGSQISVPFLATTALDIVMGHVASLQARIAMPLLEIVDAKVNKLDPDGKTMYLDVALMSVKNATHSIFGVVRTTDTAAYA